MQLIPTLRRSALVLGAASMVACLSVAAAPHAHAALSDPFDALTGSTQLTSDVLGNLDHVSQTGVVDPAQRISIGVELTRPDAAGENAYLADVYNPSSPNYRHFLDLTSWQARFGVSQERFARTVSWLQTSGLTVTTLPGDTQYVLAAGPAVAVEALLGVQLDTYTAAGTAFYANTAAPTVPANLGVLGVAGLQSFTHMRTLQQIHRAAIASGAEPAHEQRPAAPSTVSIGSTTPQDLWSIYDQPANNLGQGESMAIFGWGCTEPSDGAACAGTDIIGNLRSDEATFGLPQIPVYISHYGTQGEAISDNSGTGEWELDLPASTGMAPEADFEHLYFGDSGADADILAAYDAWNFDQSPEVPRQGSSSFAGCEATPLTNSQPGGPGNPPTGPGSTAIGNPSQDQYESELKMMVELGRTMFNSAGDLGANGCPYDFTTALNGVTPTETQINNYPSSSNYVTTVGGTVLYWNGACGTGTGACTAATRFLEYSWTHSGGGTSLFISAPPWQSSSAFHTDTTSAPGVTAFCATDWHTSPNLYPPGTMCRGLPDVAAQSGDILSNGYFAGAGTSLSSPLWLGMWARIQAAAPLSAAPKGLGFATPLIYANNAVPSKYEKDFFDIGGVVPAYNPGATNTATLSSCDPAPGPYACSGSGWDYASGWGTPDVTNLMNDLDGGTAPTHIGGYPANVPEAPVTPLLVLGGIVAAAGIVLRRRERRPAAA